MTKKKIGMKVWNVTKSVASLGVGVGTALVTTTICMAYAPAYEVATTVTQVAQVAHKAGTYGLSAVTGSVAAQLAKQEIDYAEEEFKAKIHDIMINGVDEEVKS